MYHGWNSAGVVNTVSLVCGFLIIFMGVYLLDSIARAGMAKPETDAGKRDSAQTASVSHDEYELSSQDDLYEKGQIFHNRHRSRAVSI
ncbi:unnamed protein product [Umbelopsis sp. WA50703]